MISVRGKFVEWKTKPLKNIGKTAVMIETQCARPRHQNENQGFCGGLERPPVFLAKRPKGPRIALFSCSHGNPHKEPSCTDGPRLSPFFTGLVRGKFVESSAVVL